MTYKTILFNLADGVARLTLNRPERLNSFNVAMHEEVADALDRLDEARVLVLTGAGRGFCAGQDLGDRAVSADGGKPDLGDSVERRYNPLVRRLTALPFPVICAVNGVAAGAGASIALACDVVIAARSAKFIQSFANIGLIPDSGGTWGLPRLVGQARALGMALTGEPVSAEQAEAWGMIWRVVDDEALGAEVDALAAKFAGGATLGLGETKRMIREGWERTFDAQLDQERDVMRALGRSEDYAEGVAAFTGKRAARFVGL